MASFPFFKFPYHNYYYPYYPNYKKITTYNTEEPDTSINKETLETLKENKNQKKKSSKYNSFGPIRFANPFFENDLNNPIVEILGIQLYLDDIIILGLLFFLYKEDVHDEMLFFTLILLLLT